LDTKESIFGGVTLVKWELRTSNWYKADDSLKSFLFMLKNRHNIPARRFAMNAELSFGASLWLWLGHSYSR
jgi:hypothetical protein